MQGSCKVHTSLAVLAMSEKAGGTVAIFGISSVTGIDMLTFFRQLVVSQYSSLPVDENNETPAQK